MGKGRQALLHAAGTTSAIPRGSTLTGFGRRPVDHPPVQTVANDPGAGGVAGHASKGDVHLRRDQVASFAQCKADATGPAKTVIVTVVMSDTSVS